MKNFMIDLCLVIILMCVLSLFFGDYNVSKTMFQRSIDQFEENVSQNVDTDHQYVTLQDTSDNHLSSLMKVISDGCVYVIECVVSIFSNIVSLFLIGFVI